MAAKLFLPLFLLLTISAQASGASFGDFLGQVQSQIHDEKGFSPRNCAVVLGHLNHSLSGWSPSAADFSHGAKQGQSWVNTLFQIRRELQARLRHFELQEGGASASCVTAARRTLRLARYAEDYLILWVVPSGYPTLPTLRGANPQLLSASSGPVRLRSGDVLMSRGKAYTSAAIARVGEEESQFSHATQIYIDAPVGTEITAEQAVTDGRVYTIEAHIEVGSFTRPFRDYVADDNARVVQFRSDLPPADGHRGAKAVFDHVRNYQLAKMREAGRKTLDVNDNPPYDFHMSLASSDEIFCAEIVSMAAGFVGMKLPTFPSELKQNDLTRRMGISVRESFAPGDLDVEPHFEMLAEWRNLPALAGTLRKDVVFNAVYDWMEEEGYSFHPNAGDLLKAKTAWLMRQHDLGLKDRLPKNMTTTAIALDFLIDRVGAALEARVISFDADFRKTHSGHPPFFPVERANLDQFRLEDRAPFLRGEYSRFHSDFHY